MQEITPVGIATENPGDSISFYSKVLGINRIHQLGNQYGMSIIRLESPAIEIDSTLVATFDRPGSNFRQHNQRLRLVCDLEKTLHALAQHGVQVAEENGSYRFTDVNGLTWHLSDRNRRTIQ